MLLKKLEMLRTQNLLGIITGLTSGFGLIYGVIEDAGVNGGVGLPGTGLC